MGYGCQLLKHTSRRSLSLHAVTTFLHPACKLSQIIIGLCAHRHTPRAYLTYAYLTDDVLDQFKAGSTRILDISEWNEGDNLFIMDIVAPFGMVHSFLSHVQTTRFPHVNEFHYHRRHPARGQSAVVSCRPPRNPRLLTV